MRRIALGVALIAAMGIAAVAHAQDSEPAPQPQQEEVHQATVVKTVVKRPPRKVYRRAKLHIPSRPNVAQVKAMIRREAAMWGVSAASLSRRVACESGYHWWAANGPYVGVLQFHPNTFQRGLRSIRTDRVEEMVVKTRRMHSRVYRHWNNGRVSRHRGRIVRQTVVVTRVGHLNPSLTDAETQIRIGAQALRGISAVSSSEWSCGA